MSTRRRTFSVEMYRRTVSKQQDRDYNIYDAHYHSNYLEYVGHGAGNIFKQKLQMS